MKIVIEIPENTLVLALNFVYFDTESGETTMGNRMMDTDDIKAAKVKEDCEE